MSYIMKTELPKQLRLAFPLILTQFGTQIMSFVDTAMVGRLGAAELAGVGIGSALFFTVSLVGLGTVLGMEPLISQALGAQEYGRARAVLWQGIRVALVTSIPTMSVIYLSIFLLEFARIQPEIIPFVHDYLSGRLFMVVPFLVYVACRCYLQAIGKIRAIVEAMILANLINLIANYILIFGDNGLVHLGFPAIGLPGQGVFGAGLATFFAQLFCLLPVMKATKLQRVRCYVSVSDHVYFKKTIKLGVPIGLHFLAEMGSFLGINIFAAQISAVSAAAHQVAFTISTCFYTIAMAMLSVIVVRVGYHVGRHDQSGAFQAATLSLAMTIVMTCCVGVPVFILPMPFVALLTTDETVITLAILLVQIVVLFAMVDNLQGVCAAGLRGAGETTSPFLAQIISQYLFGLPLAYYLGHVLNYGVIGLWWGITLGAFLAALLLFTRLLYVTSRPIQRV